MRAIGQAGKVHLVDDRPDGGIYHAAVCGAKIRAGSVSLGGPALLTLMLNPGACEKCREIAERREDE